MVELGVIGLERISDMVRRLDEVDMMIRNEIKAEVDGSDEDLKVSSRVASLVRCRADVQSAISALLGCRCDSV
ncbi:MAG: hypothetical protein FJ004_08900 [Chloroflexi bacterium]|nr:hypothetical protein [Chloroflexota bacterium]